MRTATRLILMILALMLCFVNAYADGESWYCQTCGIYRNSLYCPDCGARRPSGGTGNDPYDMGVPDLHGRVIGMDQMNLSVLWVQTQLKATGVYYQGEIWDVTGNLGDHTMQEVAAFMRSRGYGGHNGQVDQTVIDELAGYMGERLVPVCVGGFYRYMDTIMDHDQLGSMRPIISNLRDMIPHVTTGARWVQCCLKKIGYYTGPIDGKYGEGTENAVKAFQKAAGFEQRDYVTLGVARAMLEQCYYSSCQLNDLP